MTKEIWPPLADQKTSLTEALKVAKLPYELDDDILTLRYTRKEPRYSDTLAKINGIITQLIGDGKMSEGLIETLRGSTDGGNFEILSFIFALPVERT